MAKDIATLSAADKSALVAAIMGAGLADPVASAMRTLGLDASMFEAIPFTGLAAPTEYADYITMIDNLVVSPGGTNDGVVTKANIGTASDGTTPMWSYATGTGKKVALWISGQHSGEVIAQLANIVTFAWFARSNDPRARRLRASYRVIMIPNANPSAFKAGNGGRVNANGVNLNRNWDFFWTQYVPTTGNAKGATAFSENETKAIKAVIDANDVRVILDLHNMGVDEMSTDLQVGSPSPWVHGNRSITQGAMEAWVQATGGTVSPYGLDYDGEPLLYHWANYYLANVKGVRNTMVAIVESNSNIQGGPNDRTMNEAGAGRWCNMIVALMREHMENGHRTDPARPYSYYMARLNPAGTTSVTAGGTLIDTTVATLIPFDAAFNTTIASGTYLTYRDFVAPAVGWFEIECEGYLESAGGGETRVDFVLSVDGNVQNSGFHSMTVGATAGMRYPFRLKAQIQLPTANFPDAKTMRRIGVTVRKTNAAHPSPIMQRAYFQLNFHPDTFSAPIPRVPVA